MKNISIIIPCYNEENRINKTLVKIKKWVKKQNKFNIELIIADDGSFDETFKIIKSFKVRNKLKKLKIKILKFNHEGYIKTLFKSFLKAKYEIICNMEADCAIHPKNFERFEKFLYNFDMIQGSRLFDNKITKNKSILRKIISILYSRLFRIIFKINIYDPQCGFKMYKKKNLLKILGQIKLEHDGLKISEIVCRYYFSGLKIKEIGVDNNHSEDSRLVPKFKILNPFPFLKVQIISFFALIKIYNILKKEKLIN